MGKRWRAKLFILRESILKPGTTAGGTVAVAHRAPWARTTGAPASHALQGNRNQNSAFRCSEPLYCFPGSHKPAFMDNSEFLRPCTCAKPWLSCRPVLSLLVSALLTRCSDGLFQAGRDAGCWFTQTLSFVISASSVSAACPLNWDDGSTAC